MRKTTGCASSLAQRSARGNHRRRYGDAHINSVDVEGTLRSASAPGSLAALVYHLWRHALAADDGETGLAEGAAGAEHGRYAAVGTRRQQAPQVAAAAGLVLPEKLGAHAFHGVCCEF